MITTRRLAQTALLICIVLAVGACSSLPENVERTPSFTQVDNRATGLYRELSPHLEAHPEKSGFHTLIEGEEAFVARLRLVMAAEKTIDAQYYIWHDDLTGRALHHQLLAAADRGVRVRLLLDDLDTAGKDATLRLINAHPNVEIRLFNPFANRERRVGDFVGDTRRINRRMHNKTLTVDNIATIFGGRNIGDEYFAATEDVGFGDMDALAVGPIAGEVSQQFDLYWNSNWAYPIESFNWNDPVDAQAVADFRARADERMEAARQSSYAKVISQFDMAVIDGIAELDFVWSGWLLAYDQPDKVVARKVKAETHLAPKLKQGMDRTQRDLIIVSPYFVPGDDFTAYLVGLVDSGVRVRILTNSLQANDVSLVHAGYMRYRKDLVAGGIELYEFKADARRLQGRKKNDRIGASRASLHAKFFGFDETYLFIGSFNLDGRSVALNTELGAYFASPVEAQTLSGIFDERIFALAYRLRLDPAGRLEWVTVNEGEEQTFSREPDTTWWKRFSTAFLSLFVPESML